MVGQASDLEFVRQQSPLEQRLIWFHKLLCNNYRNTGLRGKWSVTRTAAPTDTGLDLLLVEEFFDEQTCAQIIGEARAAWGGPATVYQEGSASPIDESLRKTTRFMLTPETTEFVRQRLLAQLGQVAGHFRMNLNDCEAPQFLYYKAGDFFVPHQDGNTEQLQFDHLRVRRVSVVIFLSRQTAQPAPDAYCGGSLAFYAAGVDPQRKDLGCHLPGVPGRFVAFRADTTHEVTAVTHGERYSIVSWYR